MENKFKWNDETVKEFVLFYNSHSDWITGIDPIMDKVREFKYVRTSTEKPKWEIILFVRGNLNWLLNNGKYHNELGGYHDVMPVNNTEIKKVRRLSDNEIISVGETKIQHNMYADGLLVDKIELKIKDEWQQILVYAGSRTFILDYLRVQKQPLFITEDGYEIFKGDEYWHIISDWTAQMENAVEGGKEEYAARNIKRFSTKQAADEYALMNKPCLSVEDFIKLFKSDNVRESPLVKDIKALAILKTGSADR